MTLLRLSTFLPAAALLTLVGCGNSQDGLADESFRGAPLAVIRGTLSAQDPSVIDGPVSVSLMWLGTESSFDGATFPRFPERNLVCDGEPAPEPVEYEVIYNGPGYFALPARIAQTVTLEASFPLRFEIPIGRLPPEDARLNLSLVDYGRGEYAEAAFVVFVDSNGNGEFDAPSANTPADQVLAFDPLISLNYLDGSLDADLETGGPARFPQGFSLSTLELDDQGLPVSRQVSALEDGVDLELASTPDEKKQAERWACTSVVLRDEYGGPVSVTDQPDYTRCSDDNLYFFQSRSREMVSDRTCVLRRRVVEACIAPDAAVPEDWPCPAD